MQKACAQPPREYNKETGMPDSTKEAGGPELTFDHLSPQCIYFPKGLFLKGRGSEKRSQGTQVPSLNYTCCQTS